MALTTISNFKKTRTEPLDIPTSKDLTRLPKTILELIPTHLNICDVRSLTFDFFLLFWENSSKTYLTIICHQPLHQKEHGFKNALFLKILTVCQ